jgi:hypothetical protein
MISPERGMRWLEHELATRGRSAQPSARAFPAADTQISEADAPAVVSAACRFYRDHCSDWGGAWILRYPVDGETLDVVYAGTDGDEGWVELYDAGGQLLAAATLVGDRIHWEDQAEARARVTSGILPT